MQVRVGLSELLIGLFIVLTATAHAFVPDSAAQAHNLIQHMYSLPLIVAGIRHGWRGAVWAALFAGIFQVMYLVRIWEAHPYLAHDQILEFPIFCLAGVVSGLLSEQERRHRRSLEATKERLEVVLDELSKSVESVKRAERLSVAGQLAAGLAHEIRNPLASLTGAAGLMKRGHVTPQQMSECIEIIEMEATRLNRLLTEFLQFARPRTPRWQTLDLWGVVESAIALAQHSASPAKVELLFEAAAPSPEMSGDPELLKQVVLNLLLNAIQVSPESGRVMVRGEVHDGQAAVMVMDQGPGLKYEDAARVFEPFFTTKSDGTGLGLAVARGIAEQHGGMVTAQNAVSGGACFRLELPLQRQVTA